MALKADEIDPSLSPRERAEQLVAQMTLAEKVGQMIHPAPLPAIERLGIPAYNWWNEVLHGIAFSGKATVFPQAIGMAASFDDSLMLEVASAISDEVRAKYHESLRMDDKADYFGLSCFSPNINIFRDPRWGRGQETYGEDPYLTSRMGCAFVKGLQGDDPSYLKTVAMPKHFAVHSGPEKDRRGFNATCSQRDLFETYLPAFKACVQEAQAEGVMAAYNRTNGEPCCASSTLLQKILRKSWGFRGSVISDSAAIDDIHMCHGCAETKEESVALAAKNGCDMNIGWSHSALLSAVREGLVTEEEITACAVNLFTARYKLGCFEAPEKVCWTQISESTVHCEKHREIALQMARESLVLLKNENGTLPLRKSLHGVAVIGPNARSVEALQANYSGYAPGMITPLDGILEKLSAGTQVTHHIGCELFGTAPIHPKLHRQMYLMSTRMTGEDAQTVEGLMGPADVDAIIAVMGLNAELEGEQGWTGAGDGDRMNPDLPGRQMELLKKLKSFEKPVVAVIMAGRPVNVEEIGKYADAILYAWYPGEQGGRAIADVLFGDYNPAGRLPVTFVKSPDDLPDIRDYSMKGRTYRFSEKDPAFHFGFGLSYTSFEYSGFQTLEKESGTMKVSACVKNSGAVAGDEVVQLYVRDEESSVPVPNLQLRGFRRIHLLPGEEKTVCFTLNEEDFRCFSDEGTPFVEPGWFELSIGGGQPCDPHGKTAKGRIHIKWNRIP